MTVISRFVHEVGTPMHVEIVCKTGDVKVDNHAMAQMALARSHALRSAASSPNAAALEEMMQAVRSGDPTGPASTVASAFTGSFGDDTGQGTIEERIAKLRQLLNKGILTESEFQAQRQRIIDSI